MPPSAKRAKTETPTAKHELQKIGLVVLVKDGEKISVGFVSVPKDTSEAPVASYLDWEKYREMHPHAVMDSLNVHRHLRNNSNFLCAGINTAHAHLVKNNFAALREQAASSRAKEELKRQANAIKMMEELNELKSALDKKIANLSTAVGKNFDDFQGRWGSRVGASPLARTPAEFSAGPDNNNSPPASEFFPGRICRPAKRNIDFSAPMDSGLASKLLMECSARGNNCKNDCGEDDAARGFLDSPPMMDSSASGNYYLFVFTQASHSLTSLARATSIMSAYSLHAQSCAERPALSSRSLPCAAM